MRIQTRCIQRQVHGSSRRGQFRVQTFQYRHLPGRHHRHAATLFEDCAQRFFCVFEFIDRLQALCADHGHLRADRWDHDHVPWEQAHIRRTIAFGDEVVDVQLCHQLPRTFQLDMAHAALGTRPARCEQGIDQGG